MRITDPEKIDERLLADAIDNKGIIPVVQFSMASACRSPLLADLNRCCERFGAKLDVRFYGHYGSQFDCMILRQIPAVRSLLIDCLQTAEHIEEIHRLEHLERLVFGVYTAQVPRLLAMPNLHRLRGLILTDMEQAVDLGPLSNFKHLERLTICGHTKGIDVLGSLASIKRLSLNMIPRRTKLGFVGKMTGLETVSLVLGGRIDLVDLAHPTLQRLEVVRVQGLQSVDLGLFPFLVGLSIEDQIKVRELNLRPVANVLEFVRIWNCKTLSALEGLDQLSRLKCVWAGSTAVDEERFLRALPPPPIEVGFFSGGKKRDDARKLRLLAMGYQEGKYTNVNFVRLD